ncbi:MAG: DUF456 domain-containing protein [Syntrophomonadaceae bacterium]|nr:DUF456 domain-containing protein [Syntrophomonadaceae bacterium]
MNTAIVIITVVVILLGIAGTFLPVLPGIPVIFIAIAAYGWYEGFQTVTPAYLTVMAVLTILSLLVDYLAVYWGAKYFKSSKMGLYGAVLGGLAGLFFPPVGLLIGPWVGAFIGELMQGNDWSQSVRSGTGAVIGLFSGIAFKVIIGMGMLISFLIVIF